MIELHKLQNNIKIVKIDIILKLKTIKNYKIFSVKLPKKENGIVVVND
ncbi:hypothetical protein [Clostridium fallax]|nr:hypothetical protein [Clostridium fallax]